MTVSIQPEGTLVRSVASEVRGVIAKFGMKQADLAKFLGLSQGAISNRMRGTQAFQLHEIELLANWFSTTPQVLMGFATEPRPHKPIPTAEWCAHRGSNPGPWD